MKIPMHVSNIILCQEFYVDVWSFLLHGEDWNWLCVSEYDRTFRYHELVKAILKAIKPFYLESASPQFRADMRHF